MREKQNKTKIKAVSLAAAVTHSSMLEPKGGKFCHLLPK